MLKRIKFLSVLIFLIISFANCSKQQNVNFIFITGSKVKLMSEPSSKSKRLQYVKCNEIISHIEEVKVDNDRWFKVKIGKLTGYIENSREDKEEISVFYKNVSKECGVALTDPVEVYSILNATTAPLFKINRGNYFYIEAQEGDGDSWLYIKTQSGKTGFILGSQILRGDLKAVQTISKSKLEKVDAWVQVSVDKPKFLNIPGPSGRLVTKKDPAKCTHRLELYPKKNGFAPVSEKISINGINYFHVERMFSSGCGCEGGINAWISEKDVLFIPDFFAYSLKQNQTHLDKNLLELLNREIAGNLNAATVNIKKVNLGEIMPEAEFFKVRCEKGDQTAFGDSDTVAYNYFLVAKRNNKYLVLHSMKVSDIDKDDCMNSSQTRNYWNEELSYLIIRDIDQDNKFELIQLDSGEADLSFIVYRFVDGKYKKIIQFGVGGLRCVAFDDIRKMDFRHIVFFKNCYGPKGKKTEWMPVVKLDRPPFDKKYENNEIRVLEFKDGEYVEIDADGSGLDFKKSYNESLPCTDCPNTENFACKAK